MGDSIGASQGWSQIQPRRHRKLTMPPSIGVPPQRYRSCGQITNGERPVAKGFGSSGNAGSRPCSSNAPQLHYHTLSTTNEPFLLQPASVPRCFRCTSGIPYGRVRKRMDLRHGCRALPHRLGSFDRRRTVAHVYVSTTKLHNSRRNCCINHSRDVQRSLHRRAILLCPKGLPSCPLSGARRDGPRHNIQL